MASSKKSPMEELWETAQKRFLDRTGQKLQTSPPKTLDEVRKDIESLSTKGDSANIDDRSHAFKDNAMAALHCIKLLGGVAAQGASMVFGPANLCFNAASLLLEIPKQVHDFHELVDSIFEKVAGFLHKFKIYQRIEQFARIDALLVETVHELMMSFVDLCALSIRANKGGFFKRLGRSAKKVLLDDDLGIGGELDHFRLLSETQSAVQETLTLEEVLKTGGKLTQVLNNASETNQKISEMSQDVRYLTQAEKDRKLEQIAKEHREKIAKKLLVRKETSQASDTRYFETWNNSVEKTGDWLRKNDHYIAWANGDPDTNPLLLLTGDTNTGKSYLVSAIAHDLQAARAAADPSSRKLAVAHYFFSKSADKAAKAGQDPRPVETALKHMCLQISEKDTDYAKIMAAFCDSKDDVYFKDLTCADLWRDLNFAGARPDTAYYLLFDGLDQLPDENRQELLKVFAGLPATPDTQQAHVRVLLSGKPETFRGDLPSPAPVIDIERENHSEIRRFIEHKLKDDNILQGPDAKTAELRQLVFDELSSLGNYFKVQSALENINNTIDAEGEADDVRRVVSEANQDSAIIARTLKDELGEVLSGREIDELNELLIWVINAFGSLNVEQLQAALFLRFNTISLKPLQKKLEGKYSKVFDIDSENDVSINPDLEGVLTTDKSRRTAIEEEPKITATITITNAGIRTVQNFLWTLTEKAMIDKFKFDNTTAAVVSKPSIGMNIFDGNLTILQHALRVIQAEPDEKTRPLVQYMLEWLPDHLERVIGDSRAEGLSDSEKRYIGSSVYALFVDGDILEQHGSYFLRTYFNWMEVQPGISAFWKCLTNKDAIGYLGKRDKEWLNRVESSSNRHQDLLQPVAIMVAKHWLQNRDWDVEATYDWIKTFLDIVWIALLPWKVFTNQKQETGNDAHDSEDGRTTIALSDVHTDHDQDEDGVSVTRTSSAMSGTSDPSSIPAPEVPDTTSIISDDTKEATISVNMRNIIRALAWAQEHLPIEELDSLCHERLGQTFLSLDETAEAITAYKTAQDQDPSNWRSTEGLALAHAQEENYSLAVSEMEKVIACLQNETQEAERQKTMLLGLLSLANWHTELKDTGRAMQYFQEALKIEPDNSRVQFSLLKLLLQTNQEAQARELLDELAEKKAQDSDLSQLGAVLQPLIEDESYDLLFGMLFTTVRGSPIFPKLMEALRTTTEFAKLEKRTTDHALLLVYTGIATYHYDQSETRNPAAASELWESCRALPDKESSWKLFQTVRQAVRLLSSFHFTQAEIAPNQVLHTEKLEKIATDHQKYGDDLHTRIYLGCYHARVTADRSKARDVFLEDMTEAIGLLYDEEEWNDYLGFYRLAGIFMHYGDKVNALAAWCMVGPYDAGVLPDLTLKQADNPEQARFGPLSNNCDGRCGKNWTFADDFNCCQICPDVQLCHECLGKLKAGTLKRFVCNATHEWLHVPKWDDEAYSKLGIGKIRAGGSIENGVRVGGEPVPVEDWLDMIREEWGIARPVKEELGEDNVVVETD